VLVAGGSGTRVGGPTNKVLLALRGVPVLAWSLRTALALPYVEQVVVVAREQDLDAVSSLVEQHAPEGRAVGLVVGGRTRHDSEWNGLRTLRAPETALDVVVVHDAARPLAEPALFDRVVQAAHEHGAAVPGRPQHSLVSRDGREHVRGLVAVQTPQAFRAAPLMQAYRRAAEDGFTGTDTAGCVAAYTDLAVRLVSAPATNLKVTFPEDVALAERLLPLSR
jgi:2-C-methyl-D-erythritol 4-phosphate cytidylyltransferase